jgi:serine O-acetyltransferase
MHRIDQSPLPSPGQCVEVVGLCQEVLFPGYFGHRDLTASNIGPRLNHKLEQLHQTLQEQLALCHPRPDEACWQFLQSLPDIRQSLLIDAQAALDSDPAALSISEIVLAYPGFVAIMVHRLAHRLHQLGAPLLARMLSEWAHTQSGADIHPAAQIGPGFFLDHATGVVIGATSVLGHRVRLYQGVILGALSLPRDDQGKVIVTGKRHPTLEDDVIVYANAIILGGQTVVGRGSVVGASVLLTRSIPAGHRVILDPPKLRIQSPERPSENGQVLTCAIDFEI